MLFVLFAGLEINGIVGVLFAAPVAAIAIVTVVHLYRLWQDLPDDLLSNIARTDARRAGKIAPAPQPPSAVAAAGKSWGRHHPAPSFLGHRVLPRRED